MKRIILLTCLIAVGLACVAPQADAQAPKTKYEFAMYHVVLVKPGPNWKSQNTEEGMNVRMQVIENIQNAAEGLVVSAGLVNDESDVEMIMIFNLETKYEAMELAKKSPNIQNGFYTVEIFSWHAPKGLSIKSLPRDAK